MHFITIIRAVFVSITHLKQWNTLAIETLELKHVPAAVIVIHCCWRRCWWHCCYNTITITCLSNGFHRFNFCTNLLNLNIVRSFHYHIYIKFNLVCQNKYNLFFILEITWKTTLHWFFQRISKPLNNNTQMPVDISVLYKSQYTVLNMLSLL